MELCATLYREVGLKERFERIGRAWIVLLLFVMIMVISYDVGQSGININFAVMPAEEITVKSETIESTAAGSIAVEPDMSAAKYLTEMMPVLSVAEMTESALLMSSEKISGTSPKLSDISIVERTTAAVPTIPNTELPSVSDKPEAVLPFVPEEPETILPSVPDEPEVSVPPVSDVTEEPGITAAPATEGFLVDETGMIYGVTDELVITDGYLALPSEGCTGVASGAFANAPGGICEIYIPSNITYIAEGAFRGLFELEWFEAAGSGAYYTEDGVLLSEGGTCILSFPPGRIGSYKIPAGVSRFACDSFAGARIDTLDATECVIADAGNLPETILFLQR